MAKKAMIVLAEGFEEIEAITPLDVLRRAGIEVILAGLSGTLVRGSRGVTVQADVLLKDQKELPDILILPGGGPGSKNLASSPDVAEWVKKMNAAKKWIGAICAAPALVLAPTGILDGRRATCYPGCEEKFSSSVVFSDERVVVDGNVVTSRAPGSAMEFALKLVELTCGRERAASLREEMLVRQ